VETLSIIMFGLASAALIGWGMWKRENILQLPFFVGLVCFGWMLPQMIGLTNDPFIPEDGLTKTALFGTACVVAMWAGHRVGNKPIAGLEWELDNQLMFIVAAVLMLLGAFFFLLVRAGAAAATEEFSGQWTGTITIYYFFSRLLGYGLIISVVGFLQRPSKGWIALVACGTIFYLDRIINFGRRSELIELLLIVGMMVWFHRRYVPSRPVVAAGAIAVMLVVTGIGNYRSFISREDSEEWGAVTKVDFVDSFRDILSNGGEEVRNAVYNIEATARTLDFDWGLSVWNGLVAQYVPGQLIGNDVKQSLMIQFEDVAYREFGHIPFTGSTPTGLSDAFMSFGYLGFIKFFIIAYVMGRLWVTAARGHQAAQILLLVMLTPAIQMFTHSTNWLLKDIPQVVLGLLVPLFYARKRTLPGALSAPLRTSP
jgi:hypothetical protein